MSNQNPRYGFGNPKCVSHSFLLQSLPSSTTSDTSGVQRPTDCLWSGWMRWERGLNCPEHDPRTNRSSHGTPIVVSWSQSSDPGRSTGKSSHPRTSLAFQRWKMRFSIWIWMNKGPLWIVPRPLKRLVVRSRQRRCLSSRSSRSFQGAGLSPSQGKAKLEVTALAKDRRFWGQDQRLQNKWACVSFRNWQVNKSSTFAPRK